MPFMAYVALYRQWRPQDFDNLIGQDHVSTTLKNAIRTGKIAHAYLFTGPRGTGKTSTAKILAKALNCDQGPTPSPCNTCPNCQRITAGNSMDVFEIDAASNRGIDEIRDLREAVKFAPVDGRYKVYIIDEVHMLTTEAFNALLKTLEEPPAHVVFVLATTEPHKIPATIHSRCQRYDFRRIAVGEIESRLADVAQNSELKITPEALRLIAVHADGGLRDALSILDQCASLGADPVTDKDVRTLLGLVGHEWVWRLTEASASRDVAAALITLNELILLGKDIRQVLVELALHIRSLMLYKAAPDIAGIELYNEDRTVLAEQSTKFTHEELTKMIGLLQAAANEAKWAQEPRITAEMALIDICRRVESGDISALAERVAALETAMSAPRPVKPITREPVNKETALVHPQPEVEKPAAPDKNKQVSYSSSGEVWETVLKDLLADGKRSVHACVSQGQLVSLTDSQATLQFASAFAKERSEKEDYRKIIEKMLAHVLNRSVRLACTLGDTPKPPQEEAAATVGKKEQAENHPALNQAIKMFGGKVIKEEK
jgi:DNA polymerase-3 subunit gamma/tau